jgi:hypothetical protein
MLWPWQPLYGYRRPSLGASGWEKSVYQTQYLMNKSCGSRRHGRKRRGRYGRKRRGRYGRKRRTEQLEIGVDRSGNEQRNSGQITRLEAGLNQPSPNILHIADGCAAVAQTDGYSVERDGSERGTILVIEP